MADDFDFVDDPAYTALLLDTHDQLGKNREEGGRRRRRGTQEESDINIAHVFIFALIFSFIFIITESVIFSLLFAFLICISIRFLLRSLFSKRRRSNGRSPKLDGRIITIDKGANGNVSGNNSSWNGVYNDLHSLKLLFPCNNTVVINDGRVKGFVYGGEASCHNSAGSTVTVSGNSVTINGGVLSGFSVAGGCSVHGGYVSCEGSDDSTVTASGNSVTINDGVVKGSVRGGEACIRHSLSGNSDDSIITASGNSVTVNGGVVRDSVYGGEAVVCEPAYGDYTVTASGNSVFISGGTVATGVRGVVCGGYASNTRGIATATNNTVTISGNPIFNPTDTQLYGGRISTKGGDAFTGNTLNLHAVIEVRSIENFQTLNFHLPATMTSGGTMLALGNANIDGSIINVSIDAASQPLDLHDRITLIDATRGRLRGTPANNTGSCMQGSTKYDFAITMENNKLIATVTRFVVNPWDKAHSMPVVDWHRRRIQMKIAGKTPKRLFEDAYIVVDADGDEFPILIRAVDPLQFSKDYPAPIAPSKKVGDLTVENLNDAGYMAADAARDATFNDWLVLASIRDTPGMEWDTVKLDDPTTWKNWKDDLKSIMLPAEITALHSKVLDLQGLNSSKKDEARKRFLASRAGTPDKL